MAIDKAVALNSWMKNYTPCEKGRKQALKKVVPQRNAGLRTLEFS